MGCWATFSGNLLGIRDTCTLYKIEVFEIISVVLRQPFLSAI